MLPGIEKQISIVKKTYMNTPRESRNRQVFISKWLVCIEKKYL